MANTFTAEDFFGKLTTEEELNAFRIQRQCLISGIESAGHGAFTKEEVLALIRCTIGTV